VSPTDTANPDDLYVADEDVRVTRVIDAQALMMEQKVFDKIGEYFEAGVDNLAEAQKIYNEILTMQVYATYWIGFAKEKCKDIADATLQ
jgi:hypothetical protein